MPRVRFQPLGVISIFGALQRNDAFIATAPTMLSAWNASSRSLYDPGTIRMGDTFPNSAVTGLEISGACRAFLASRSGPGGPQTIWS